METILNLSDWNCLGFILHQRTLLFKYQVWCYLSWSHIVSIIDNELYWINCGYMFLFKSPTNLLLIEFIFGVKPVRPENGVHIPEKVCFNNTNK